MVVDLDHLVVQLIGAVEQSHSKGVCHGEKGLSRELLDEMRGSRHWCFDVCEHAKRCTNSIIDLSP
uniref:Uncharacterized protein n=1 Tax=Arundo donax TaxID=35708 RepID=A0A0A9GH91_ARUDO